MKHHRNSWYEDDVVDYTSSGKFVKIPDKYKTCKRYGKLKGFRTARLAEVSLSFATHWNKSERENFTIFQCDHCRLFHIISNKNYIKHNIDIKK